MREREKENCLKMNTDFSVSSFNNLQIIALALQNSNQTTQSGLVIMVGNAGMNQPSLLTAHTVPFSIPLSNNRI
jgi:hypothetical protein